ncbi:MAG: UTP--glucose-1-phosphate uridylyltransferase GalU [Dehalococcoidales bacterium]|nr:UTP--glucose-1-phosphate uridylyltransferase GalU [Dehalococcoidales bacterium]
MKVRKVIITVAGRGTRFLPLTRSQPKEMLPLINKPLIQYAVEEAIGSGIEQIILITALGKHAIEDYFDRSLELEHVLEQKGKTKLLQEMRELSSLVNICYIRQKEQLGLGHAILTAREIIGDEPFAVILPDDIIDSPTPVLRQMIAIYEHYRTNVIAVEPVNHQDTVKYGIIEPEEISPRLYRVLSLVEKPRPSQAPSNLGVVGRYILMPEIFDALTATPPGKIGEIQLTDALQLLLGQQTINAYEFEGKRYDTGNPLGWLKANVAFGLKEPGIREELKKYLAQLE